MSKLALVVGMMLLIFSVNANAQTAAIGPVTTWHFAANGNFSGNTYTPAKCAFNVADVSSVSVLNSLPAGVMGLVYIGYSSGGADSTFQSMVNPFIGNPRVLGFYLADEPDITGTWGTYYSPANLEAQSDYIHAHFQNAKTFIVLANQGSDSTPTFVAKDKNTGKVSAYTYSNTHVDYFGLDPYPIQSQFSTQLSSNSQQFITTYITGYVSQAISSGITKATIIPVYQAFGNYSGGDWVLPTVTQQEQIFNAWAALVPTPYFDYTYSWGTQDGDTALSDASSLQPVFTAHNTDAATPPPPPAAANYTISTSAGSGGSITPASATVISGGSQTFTITPDSGYNIKSVTVDGDTLSSPVDSYTFVDVTTNHSISATFTPASNRGPGKGRGHNRD